MVFPDSRYLKYKHVIVKWCFVVESSISLNKMMEGAKTVVLSPKTKWSKWEVGA
jgi:hypothetical protein